jgi:dephospho-CoA kinase
MTVIIGLTGSIGMGKTTTASFFAEEGIPVWNADEAVHRLYAKGGAAVMPISALFPEAVEEGAVNRPALKRIIATAPEALDRIERVVHPLIAKDRQAFLDRHAGDEIAVLDVPLLFEAGLDAICDVTVTVSTDPTTQRSRVLSRPGMTEEQFGLILARQLPDAVKRARADLVIDTSTLEGARSAVQTLITELQGRQADA